MDTAALDAMFANARSDDREHLTFTEHYSDKNGESECLFTNNEMSLKGEFLYLYN
jgi:hypothetical protein